MCVCAEMQGIQITVMNSSNTFVTICMPEFLHIHAMVMLMPDLYALYLCTYIHAMVTLMLQSVRLVSLHLRTCHGYTDAPGCLQVVPGIDKKKASADSVTLVEVGPRVCLNPIKIFGGSFGGPVLFDNPHFVSPNRVSAPTSTQQVHTALS